MFDPFGADAVVGVEAPVPHVGDVIFVVANILFIEAEIFEDMLGYALLQPNVYRQTVLVQELLQQQIALVRVAAH